MFQIYYMNLIVDNIFDFELKYSRSIDTLFSQVFAAKGAMTDQHTVVLFFYITENNSILAMYFLGIIHTH